MDFSVTQTAEGHQISLGATLIGRPIASEAKLKEVLDELRRCGSGQELHAVLESCP